jgi:glycosyltransferase involved in cell wall biosynthesis
MINNISVVIITKNASSTIGATLSSLKEFKEVIIYDSGSIDNTLDIINSYKNTFLYSGDFFGFGDTKNHAISLSSNDWIFSLDADESISDELIKSLNDLHLEPKLAGQILRKNFFMDMEMNSSGWNRDKLIRLFNRNDFCFSKLKVHEKVEIDSSAKVININGCINHLAISNISQTLEKANFYSELYASENQTLYPIVIILMKAQFAFFRTYFLQKGFLNGWRGLVLAFSNSVGVFYKYIKIYAKHKTKK